MRSAKQDDGAAQGMARAPVVSSVIQSIGYDAEHAVLEIEFVSQQVYRYHFVPRQVWNELMQAASKGRYFDGCIRKKFPAARIT